MKSILRVGVVGYGYWGSKHVRVLAGLENVRLTVIEQHEGRLGEAVRAFPSVGSARTTDEVLDELDALVVATPPAEHAPVALPALEAGVHCLVEKPLATSAADAERMVDAAAANGACLMVGHTFEYNAAVWKLKELVSGGDIGPIYYIDTARLSLGRYQFDCDVIWDLAPHDISIVTYLLDEMPATVSVWSQRNLAGMHPDVAFMRLEFAVSRATAFVHVSWLDPRKVRRVTVAGAAKMAVYNDMSDERVRVYDAGVDPHLTPEGPRHAVPLTYRTGDIVSPYISFAEPLLVQDRHFVECIRSGRRPRTPGERGLEIVRVLEAADRAHGGAVVVLEPSRRPRVAAADAVIA